MRILRTHIKPRRVTDQELEPLYLERESTPLRYQIDHDGMWHSCALSNELFLDTHQHTPLCVDNHQITTTIDPQRKEPHVSKAVTRHFPPQNQRNKKKLSIFNISLTTFSPFLVSLCRLNLIQILIILSSFINSFLHTENFFEPIQAPNMLIIQHLQTQEQND